MVLTADYGGDGSDGSDISIQTDFIAAAEPSDSIYAELLAHNQAKAKDHVLLWILGTSKAPGNDINFSLGITRLAWERKWREHES